MHPFWTRGQYEISCDPARVDLTLVHRILASSYWARGIPLETVRRSLLHSLCFGIYHHNQLVGFARVITDHATFAYLADVFVLEAHRGQGLSKWLMQCILAHPELQNLRRWSLVTQDAHGLYQQFGFTDLASPERWMERHDAGVYARK